MKVFIVLAHPDQRSLNAALVRYAKEVLEDAGHEVKVGCMLDLDWFSTITCSHKTLAWTPKHIRSLPKSLKALTPLSIGVRSVQNEIQSRFG